MAVGAAEVQASAMVAAAVRAVAVVVGRNRPKLVRF